MSSTASGKTFSVARGSATANALDREQHPLAVLT
jgi:hypothetical protein